MPKDKRVVITGMGVCAPRAKNINQFRKLLQSGESAIQHISELEEFGFACQVGGIAIDDLPNYQEISDYYELEDTAHFVKLTCSAGIEAWQSAGLPIPLADDKFVNWNMGSVIGTGISGIDVIGKKSVAYTNAKRIKRLSATTTQNIMPSAPSAYLSNILALGNKNLGISSACCSATDAIINGYYQIKNGLADVMLTGGAEGYSPYFWAGFDSMRVLNRYNNESSGKASRPLSKSARGFVPSSGAGILVLEEREHALQRGAKIIAEIKGGFSNSGGHRNGGSMTFPNKEGIQKCLQQTAAMAGMSPSEIDLVNGHLTATKADTSEVRAWYDFFSGKIPYLNASKSIFGHALGAAGGLESIATLLQMKHSFIHANLNSEDMHDQIHSMFQDFSSTTTVRSTKNINTAIKANFGFGDVNSALIFSK